MKKFNEWLTAREAINENDIGTFVRFNNQATGEVGSGKIVDIDDTGTYYVQDRNGETHEVSGEDIITAGGRDNSPAAQDKSMSRSLAKWNAGGSYGPEADPLLRRRELRKQFPFTRETDIPDLT